MNKVIAIIGAGNIGLAIAEGVRKAEVSKSRIIITRKSNNFSETEKTKFECKTNNKVAVASADVIIVAVQPQQANEVFESLAEVWSDNKLLISVVSGVSIERIEQLSGATAVVRAMPNTAVRAQQSMTCLALNGAGLEYQEVVHEIFGSVGQTLVIPENKFAEATVLCGSGTAIAMKFLRAFMQSCIQHGFHAHEATLIASQVLAGAAEIMQESSNHPEAEIDRVTTPGGCTIVALAEMEHTGFTSAILRTIQAGIDKARKLYS